MLNIVVTTPKSESENSKQEAAKCINNDGGYYFRRLPTRPKNIDVGSKIFYVEDGYIRGFGVISNIEEKTEDMKCTTTGTKWRPGIYVTIPANSWQWIKPIPMKGFQGWRYLDENMEFTVVGGWKDRKPE